MAIVEFTCLHCGETVRRPRSPAHRSPRFCSQRCNGAYRAARRQGPTPNHEFRCEFCGRVVQTYRSPSQAGRQPPRYCSIECLGLAQRAEGNPAFTGGRHPLANGYMVVLMPSHPGADSRGYVYEHRLVAEAKLGRRLLPGEIVHHINGDRHDNRPGNLQVFRSQQEHLAHHRRLRNAGA